jgi:hypothetical protein
VPPEKKQNYEQKAAAIRARARKTHDAEARAQLLIIASLYDKLARHLPLMLQAKRPDNPPPEDPAE